MDKGGEGVQNPENFADVLYAWSLNGERAESLRHFVCLTVFLFGPLPPPVFVDEDGVSPLQLQCHITLLAPIWGGEIT